MLRTVANVMPLCVCLAATVSAQVVEPKEQGRTAKPKAEGQAVQPIGAEQTVETDGEERAVELSGKGRRVGRAGMLFGGSESADALKPRLLEALMSVSHAYDDDLGADQAGVSLLRPRTGGQYSDFDTSVSFVQSRPRLEVSARATGALRHYADVNGFIGSSYVAGASVIGRVSRKAVLRAHLDGYDVSSLAFDTLSRRSALDGGSPTPVALENVSVNWATKSFGGTADLERTLGGRSSLRLSYGGRRGEGPFVGERSNEQTVSSQVRHSVSPDTQALWTYAFRKGETGLVAGTRGFWSHETQVGIERQWRSSAVRRTMVQLHGGPSMVSESSILRMGERAQLARLVGSVALTYEDATRWSLQAFYRRGAGLRDTMAFANTATLDVRAWFGHRVDLTASAGFSDGDISVEVDDDPLKTTFASAKVQVGLSRLVAAYGQGFLYRYERGGVASATAYPGQLDRRGIRVGLSLWLPVR